MSWLCVQIWLLVAVAAFGQLGQVSATTHQKQGCTSTCTAGTHSGTCDELIAETPDLTCGLLELFFACDCSGCSCGANPSDSATSSPTPSPSPSLSPSQTPSPSVCSAVCTVNAGTSGTCDELVQSIPDMTCSLLEIFFGCDCSGCTCVFSPSSSKSPSATASPSPSPTASLSASPTPSASLCSSVCTLPQTGQSGNCYELISTIPGMTCNLLEVFFGCDCTGCVCVVSPSASRTPTPTVSASTSPSISITPSATPSATTSPSPSPSASLCSKICTTPTGASGNCDELINQYSGLTCSLLESPLFGCDCSGCVCPTTPSASPTPTRSRTASVSATSSVSATRSPSATPSASASASASATVSPSQTPSSSITPTSSVSPSPTPSVCSRICDIPNSDQSGTCDELVQSIPGLTCGLLENPLFGCNCTGCTCVFSKSASVSPSLSPSPSPTASPSTSPSPSPTTSLCSKICYLGAGVNGTCDELINNVNGMSCSLLQTLFGCDCSGCSCVPSATSSPSRTPSTSASPSPSPVSRSPTATPSVSPTTSASASVTPTPTPIVTPFPYGTASSSFGYSPRLVVIYDELALSYPNVALLGYDCSGASSTSDFIVFSLEFALGAPTLAPTSIVVNVYGDSSGTSLAARARDATGEAFQSTTTVVDFDGWQQLTFAVQPVPPATASGGNADGSFDTPMAGVDIVLVCTSLTAAGDMRIDSVYAGLTDSTQTLVDNFDPSPSASVTPSVSLSASRSPTTSVSATASVSSSASASVSTTITPSATKSRSETPSTTVSPSISPSISLTPSTTPSPSPSPSVCSKQCTAGGNTGNCDELISQIPDMTCSLLQTFFGCDCTGCLCGANPSESKSPSPSPSAVSRSPSATPSVTSTASTTPSVTQSLPITPSSSPTPSPSVCSKLCHLDASNTTGTCDQLVQSIPGMTCTLLESAIFNCDCSGCVCIFSPSASRTPSVTPSRTPTTTPSPTISPTPSISPCSKTCVVSPSVNGTCDELVQTVPGMSCALLEGFFGCDCGGCTCVFSPSTSPTPTPSPSPTPTTTPSVTPSTTTSASITPSSSPTPSLCSKVCTLTSANMSGNCDYLISQVPGLSCSLLESPIFGCDCSGCTCIPSASPTISVSRSPSASRSPTASQTPSPTSSASQSLSATKSVSTSPSASPTPSLCSKICSLPNTNTSGNCDTLISSNPGLTCSLLESPIFGCDCSGCTCVASQSATVTPSASKSASISASATTSPSISPSATVSPSATASGSATKSSSATKSPSLTATPSQTATPSVSPSPSACSQICVTSGGANGTCDQLLQQFPTLTCSLLESLFSCNCTGCLCHQTPSPTSSPTATPSITPTSSKSASPSTSTTASTSPSPSPSPSVCSRLCSLPGNDPDTCDNLLAKYPDLSCDLLESPVLGCNCAGCSCIQASQSPSPTPISATPSQSVPSPSASPTPVITPVPYGSTWANYDFVPQMYTVYDPNANSLPNVLVMTFNCTAAPATGDYARFSLVLPGTLPNATPSALSLWLFGTNTTGVDIAGRIVDAQGETFRSLAWSLAVGGWKQFSFSFDPAILSFGGNDDGIFDIPLVEIQLQVTCLQLHGAGEIRVDDVYMTYTSASTALVDDFDPSATPSASQSPSLSPSLSKSTSISQSSSPSLSISHSGSASATASASASISVTSGLTPTASTSFSASSTTSASVSVTATASVSATKSTTVSGTRSGSSSRSRSASVSPSPSPTPVISLVPYGNTTTNGTDQSVGQFFVVYDPNAYGGDYVGVFATTCRTVGAVLTFVFQPRVQIDASPITAVTLLVLGGPTEQQLAARVVDSTGEAIASAVQTINQNSWLNVTFSLDPPQSSSGGNNDGVVDVPIQRYEIDVICAAENSTSEIRVDNLAVAIGSTQSAIVEDFELPSPSPSVSPSVSPSINYGPTSVVRDIKFVDLNGMPSVISGKIVIWGPSLPLQPVDGFQLYFGEVGANWTATTSTSVERGVVPLHFITSVANTNSNNMVTRGRAEVSFVLTDADVPESVDAFVAFTVNSAGENNMGVAVHLQDAVYPQVVSDISGSYSVLEGNSLQLTFEVMYGTEFVWEHDGTKDPTQTNQTITLEGVTFPDSGMYRCFASNQFGTTQSGFAVVTVFSETDAFLDTLQLNQPWATGLVLGNGTVELSFTAPMIPDALSLGSWFYDMRLGNCSSQQHLPPQWTLASQGGNTTTTLVASFANLVGQCQLEVVDEETPHITTTLDLVLFAANQQVTNFTAPLTLWFDRTTSASTGIQFNPDVALSPVDQEVTLESSLYFYTAGFFRRRDTNLVFRPGDSLFLEHVLESQTTNLKQTFNLDLGRVWFADLNSPSTVLLEVPVVDQIGSTKLIENQDTPAQPGRYRFTMTLPTVLNCVPCTINAESEVSLITKQLQRLDSSSCTGSRVILVEELDPSSAFRSASITAAVVALVTARLV